MSHSLMAKKNKFFLRIICTTVLQFRSATFTVQR